METITLKLPQFEGPLELLSALVQKEEIDICSLLLKDLMDQIAGKLDLEVGAESLGLAGSLLWMKSRALLPKKTCETSFENEANEPLMLLEKLVEYCRFKEAAGLLSLKEEKAAESFFRPFLIGESLKKPFGIEHVSLEELAKVFQSLLERSKEYRGVIEEEEWRVSDKLALIRAKVETCKNIFFEELFSLECSKEELIVLFLAILELMKLGEVRVVRKDSKLVVHAKRD